MTQLGERAFSDTYEQARRKFIDAAQAAGLQVDRKIHPLRGAQGEELAMDIVRDGPADAESVLVLSSGCHGVEGFCGSGVQVAALHDASWRARARDRGIAVVYVHALNPWGFSHFGRTTHENIDLNRNFHDFTQALPVNAGYRQMHPLLVPGEWPPSQAGQDAYRRYIDDVGLPAAQAALSGGQHEFEDGLFYGGRAPSWSNDTIRAVLREQAGRAARLAWIDFHTGLGPEGVGERIYAGRNDPVAIARARAWWDGGGSTPLTSIYDGTSTSAFLTGLMSHSAYDECPQAEFTAMALEYGTVPLMETFEALRAEQWLRRHPGTAAARAAEIKRRVRDAFFIDTPQWKQKVLVQALEAMHQAVDGLAS